MILTIMTTKWLRWLGMILGHSQDLGGVSIGKVKIKRGHIPDTDALCTFKVNALIVIDCCIREYQLWAGNYITPTVHCIK